MQELKRDLTVWGAAAIVVGTVIGSGIFLVPKSMVLNVGSPGMVLFVFLFGGLLSMAGALTYAELSSSMPEAGGEYVYLREAYGPFFGFLFGWTQMWVAKSGSIATLATALFTYMANFYPALENEFAGGVKTGQLLAMAAIGGFGWLNYYGVKVGGNVQVGVTVVKVALIGLLIVVGLTAPSADFANFSTSIPAPGGVAGFFAALVAALWAYDGWNNLSMVSSEVKNPQRNLPLALIYGTLGVMAIYMLACFAYFYVLPADGVAKSDRVAAEMMRRVWGAGGAGAVSIAAMISIFAALNGSILTGARVPYAMARDGYFFQKVAEVHPQYFTPANSIIALSAWSMLLVLTGSYDQLFTYVIFASWILYGMATASVIVLRRKRPDMPRPYRTLGYPVVPVIFVLVAVALIISTLQTSPVESLRGLGIMAIGIPFYLYWKSKRTV
ncbi:MAG: amino acid permease [Acidobacteria bacterium]|nr:amino acid permease [Acidobacteriota bacterium]